MRERHLSRKTLRRLIERDSDREENLLLLHHLAVCPACYRVGGYLLDLFEAGAIDLAFSSLDIALARSRAEAPALLARLERYSFPKALGLVRDARRFRSWGLAELLCSESIKRAPESPARAVELAELAVALALVLRRDEPAEESWLEELRAYAWAHLGNARRVFGELRSAEEAFVTADACWERGETNAGDVLGYEAWILCLKASLRLAQGRLEEALALLDRALGANEAEPLRGTLLINKARVLEELERLPEAIRLLEEAAACIDPEKRPRVFLCARQNLLDGLSKAEEFERAESLLAEVQELTRAAGSDIDLLRLAWVEARLLVGRGEVERAIVRFREARDGLASHGIGFDTALVCLELAILLLREDRPQDAGALSAEMLPIFVASDVHREALAALVIFKEAAERQELTLDLAVRIHRYLLRARQNPSLHYEE